jgi:hypothetical protein
MEKCKVFRKITFNESMTFSCIQIKSAATHTFSLKKKKGTGTYHLKINGLISPCYTDVQVPKFVSFPDEPKIDVKNVQALLA